RLGQLVVPADPVLEPFVAARQRGIETALDRGGTCQGYPRVHLAFRQPLEGILRRLKVIEGSAAPDVQEIAGEEEDEHRVEPRHPRTEERAGRGGRRRRGKGKLVGLEAGHAAA